MIYDSIMQICLLDINLYVNAIYTYDQVCKGIIYINALQPLFIIILLYISLVIYYNYYIQYVYVLLFHIMKCYGLYYDYDYIMIIIMKCY